MIQLMDKNGYTFAPSERLVAAAEQDLDSASSDDGEDSCRVRLCEALTNEANALLVAEGDSRQWQKVDAPEWDGDNTAYWILMTRDQTEGWKVTTPFRAVSDP